MPEQTGSCCDLACIPRIEDYYHGLIDRCEAERRLRCTRLRNCYILRLSRDAAADTTISSENGNCEDNNSRIYVIYVLSFLASTSVCYHFKLIPRLNCFQLGGRLFDCIRCCLSRYHMKDILPGERLQHAVPPCTPPVEYHNQVLRAVQAFEPDYNHDRLGCAQGDQFLLVDESGDSDCVLVTSIASRRSGYLPRCILKKVYPDFIERLDFFHPDATANQSRKLLEKAGPYSYLLRPCDSRPGLFTLLLYNGVKFRKHRLEVVHQSVDTAVGSSSGLAFSSSTSDTTAADPPRRSSEPTQFPSAVCGDITPPLDNTATSTSSLVSLGHANSSQVSVLDPAHAHRPARMTLSVASVSYGGRLFPSVEAVVAALETYPPWSALSSAEALLHPTLPMSASDEEVSLTTSAATTDDKSVNQRTPANGVDAAVMMSTVPRVFKPVPRIKPTLESPSPPIYMCVNFRKEQQRPEASAAPYSSVEIHGQLLLLSSSRKKWKPFYARLDRNQRILSLCDSEKRKVERFDLTNCDYYPLHDSVYDRPYCLGLLPSGASPGDRDDVVLSVDYPPSIPGHFSRDFEMSAYAGRPVTTDKSQPGTAEPSAGVIHSRWVSSLRRHCRNTHLDAANDEDIHRRQTQLRCYRTLEVKFTNAKTVPPSQTKSRRDDQPLYVVHLDGIEVARAFSGSSNVCISFDDFPRGFMKLEVLTREENKRRRSVTVDFDLTHQPGLERVSSRQLLPLPDDFHQLTISDSSPALVPRSAISEVRERCCGAVSVAYRELRVLPFTYYEPFRRVLLSCTDPDLVSLFSYVWKSLPQDSSKQNFLSSLLLVTTELKCHLHLILNLFKADLNVEERVSSFRSNTLAAQMLDVYSDSFYSEWRNRCFQRVREEAFQGHPSASAPSVRISADGSLRSSSTCRDATSTTAVASSSSSSPGASVSGGIASNTTDSDLHTRLVYIVVEDLIKHVSSFPLQLRWIYSKLQAVNSGQYKDFVLCNLVFLRGLLPRLLYPVPPAAFPSSPQTMPATSSRVSIASSSRGCLNASSAGPTGASTTATNGCSPDNTSTTAHNPAFVYVSKVLLAMVSPTTKPDPKFASHGNRLLEEFTNRITMELTPEEQNEVDRILVSEACEASRKPLSRELAQLANYFLEVLQWRQPRDAQQQQPDSECSIRDSSSLQAMYTVLCELNCATQNFTPG